MSNRIHKNKKYEKNKESYEKKYEESLEESSEENGEESDIQSNEEVYEESNQESNEESDQESDGEESDEENDEEVLEDDEISVGEIGNSEEEIGVGEIGNSEDEISYNEKNEWEITDKSERKLKDVDGNQRSSYASEEEFITAMNRRGVVYVSRIPFGMQPYHLRNLFQKHAKHPIMRVHCELEPPEETARRKARGGNSKKQYKEGWVEFESKKDAIYVVQICNGKPCDYNRNARFHNQMWTMKYLKHFKWYHLTDELRMKNRIREKKLRAQVDQARREANEYLDNADQSRYKSSKVSHKKIAEGGREEKGGGEDRGRKLIFKKPNQNNQRKSNNKKPKEIEEEEKGQNIGELFEEKDVLLNDNFLQQIFGEKGESKVSNSKNSNSKEKYQNKKHSPQNNKHSKQNNNKHATQNKDSTQNKRRSDESLVHQNKKVKHNK